MVFLMAEMAFLGDFAYSGGGFGAKFGFFEGFYS
jgi:hypothetical protein